MFSLVTEFDSEYGNKVSKYRSDETKLTIIFVDVEGNWCSLFFGSCLQDGGWRMMSRIRAFPFPFLLTFLSFFSFLFFFFRPNCERVLCPFH